MIEVPDNNYIYEMHEREQYRKNVKNIRLENEEDIEVDELPFYEGEKEQ